MAHPSDRSYVPMASGSLNVKRDLDHYMTVFDPGHLVTDLKKLRSPEEVVERAKLFRAHFANWITDTHSQVDSGSIKEVVEAKVHRMDTTFRGYLDTLINGNAHVAGVAGLPPGMPVMDIPRMSLDLWYRTAAQFMGDAMHWVTTGDQRPSVMKAFKTDLSKTKVDVSTIWNNHFDKYQFNADRGFRAPAPSQESAPTGGSTAPLHTQGGGGGFPTKQPRPGKNDRRQHATPAPSHSPGPDWGSKPVFSSPSPVPPSKPRWTKRH
jgi:hypothetical protein